MSHFELKSKEEIQNLIKIQTQIESQKMAYFLAEKKIKIDKNNFILTDFVRKNFIFFENKLNAICDNKLDFIISFLCFHGHDIKKETLRMIYFRVEKERKNEK